MLKRLAENGHRFTHLPENEQVTVAVTLRRAQQCTACHVTANFRTTQTPGSGDIFNWNDPGRNAVPGAGSNTPANRASQGAGAEFRNIAGTASQGANYGTVSSKSAVLGVSDDNAQMHKTENQNLVLLGDLEMKQGRYKEAIAAYRNAYEDQQKTGRRSLASALGDAWKADDPRLQQHVNSLELATKWAQAALAAGDQDEAARALKTITDSSTGVDASVKKWIEARAKPASPAQGHGRQGSVSALPNKLIISASKRLLDQVGKGKISFEEFRKGVSVQYLDFSQK